jgi:hypothetical protein
VGPVASVAHRPQRINHSGDTVHASSSRLLHRGPPGHQEASVLPHDPSPGQPCFSPSLVRVHQRVQVCTAHRSLRELGRPERERRAANGHGRAPDHRAVEARRTVGNRDVRPACNGEETYGLGARQRVESASIVGDRREMSRDRRALDGERGQDPISDPGALEARIAVAGIGRRGERVPLEPRDDIAACRVDQRADHSVGAPGSDPREAAHTGAA